MTARVSLHRLLVVSPVVLLAVVFCIDLSGSRAFAEEATATGAEKSVEKPAWLEGTGKDLRIRLSGEVLSEDGTPAEGFRLEVSSRTRFGEQDPPVEIEGNRFSVWIPVGSAVPSSLILNAASSDGRQLLRKTLLPFQIRQVATEGLVLKLKRKRPGRMVRVEVLKDGRPVAGASVVVGTRFKSKTDGSGFATFEVMEGEKLSKLTAWTEDFMVGYTLASNPSCPTTDRYTVELHSCRPQRVRTIDAETGDPVAGLAFRLWIGTGPPNNRYLGKTPECELTTDENGEAVCHWYPDGENFRSYIKILDSRWTKVGTEVVDGAIVARMKKKATNRGRVVGRVESKDASTSGVLVRMESFQGEKKNHMDKLAAFTDSDGGFSVEYLPGATYCVYVNDARFVSNVIDLIPYEPEREETAAPVLTLSKGRPVDIVATAGPKKRPLAFQRTDFRTEHRFSWREAGKARHGRVGPRWSAVTDAQGRIRTFAPGGQVLKASMVAPEWRPESIGRSQDGRRHQSHAAQRGRCQSQGPRAAGASRQFRRPI